MADGPRLKSIEPAEAAGKVAAIYGATKATMGMVPNLFKGFANSPVALEAYVTLDKLIAEGSFTPVEQNIVRLVVSQYNGCTYCLAAHTLVGKATGLTDDEILELRRGKSDNVEYQALVNFTQQILETKGFVSDEDIDAFRAAGYTDAHIVDLVTIIAQKTLSNYFNHIHDTQLDLPAAPEL